MNCPVLNFKIKLCYLFKVTTIDFLVSLPLNKRQFDDFVTNSYDLILNNKRKNENY